MKFFLYLIFSLILSIASARAQLVINQPPPPIPGADCPGGQTVSGWPTYGASFASHCANGVATGALNTSTIGQIGAYTGTSTVTGFTPGGDISFSSPNFTVSKIKGATLGTTTATSGNVLIGSGTQWVTNPLSGDATLSSGGVLTVSAGAITAAKLASGVAIANIGAGAITPDLLAPGVAASNLGFTPLNPANNLVDVNNIISARANLGLGLIATHSTAEFLAVTNNLSEGSPSVMRTNLGLGTAATANIGNAGATVPLLNGTNTFSAPLAFSGLSAGVQVSCLGLTATNVVVPNAAACGTGGGGGGGGLTGMVSGQIPVANSSTTAGSSIPFGTTGVSTLVETDSAGHISPNLVTGLANTALSNSSMNLAGHTVSLGGSQNFAIGDLSNIGNNTIVANNSGAGGPPLALTPTQISAMLGLGTLSTQNSTSISATGGTLNGVAITGLAAPVSTSDATNKSYVDAAVTGSVLHTQVAAATAAVLPNSPTASGAGVGKTLTAGSNVALVLDGYTVLLNDRVLIKDQATASNNGIYTQTQLGTGSVPWILTRASDFDQALAGEVAIGAYTFVANGTVNSGSLWQLGAPTPTPITVDTTALTFNKLNGAAVNAVTGSGTPVVGNVAKWTGQYTLDPTGYPVATSGNSLIPLTDASGHLSNTFISGLPNTNLANSSVTVGSTSIALGGTGATIAGLSLTSPLINSSTLSGTQAGTPTYSGVPKFSGLSNGTQVSCAGLDASNNLVLTGNACNTIGIGADQTISVITTTPNTLSTLTKSTSLEQWSALTSAGTDNIPGCAAGNNGAKILEVDAGGTASTFPITITPASGTIGQQSSASYILGSSYGSVMFECYGAGTNWQVIYQSAPGSNVRSVTATTLTFLVTDNGNVIKQNAGSSAWTASIVAGGSAGFPAGGYNTLVMNLGTASGVLTPSTPSTINGATTYTIPANSGILLFVGNDNNYLAVPLSAPSGGGGSGAIVQIGTTQNTSGTGGSNWFGWTSGIGTSSYTTYEIDCLDLDPGTTASDFVLQFGEGGTPTWQVGSYYSELHWVSTAGSGVENSALSSIYGIALTGLANHVAHSGVQDRKLRLHVVISNLGSSGGDYKAADFHSSYNDGASHDISVVGSGAYYGDANVITAIRIIPYLSGSPATVINGSCTLTARTI